MAAGGSPAAAICFSASASWALPAASSAAAFSSWSLPAAAFCSPAARSVAALSSWDWVANGSTVPWTSGRVFSLASAAETASLPDWLNCASLASKTMLAEPPEEDGRSFLSLSAICWVSVPGIWKLLDRVPWNAAAAPPTATITASQSEMTSQRWR